MLILCCKRQFASFRICAHLIFALQHFLKVSMNNEHYDDVSKSFDIFRICGSLNKFSLFFYKIKVLFKI